MNKRLLGTLHRWIFIYMGIFMLVWLISGVVMALPYYWFTGLSNDEQPAIEYSTVTISPAEAVARFEQQHGRDLDVKHIQLTQIDDGLYYYLRAEGSVKGNIDARSGEPFSFPADLAEKITRGKFGIEAPLGESTYMTEHTASYPHGHLPVYRLTFEDNPGQYYYVNTDNGNVDRSTLISRIYNGIVSLHAFDPLTSITGSDKLRMGTLFITGVISLIGSVIGVILVFPLRRKRARQNG